MVLPLARREENLWLCSLPWRNPGASIFYFFGAMRFEGKNTFMNERIGKFGKGLQYVFFLKPNLFLYSDLSIDTNAYGNICEVKTLRRLAVGLMCFGLGVAEIL